MSAGISIISVRVLRIRDHYIIGDGIRSYRMCSVKPHDFSGKAIYFSSPGGVLCPICVREWKLYEAFRLSSAPR